MRNFLNCVQIERDVGTAWVHWHHLFNRVTYSINAANTRLQPQYLFFTSRCAWARRRRIGIRPKNRKSPFLDIILRNGTTMENLHICRHSFFFPYALEHVDRLVYSCHLSVHCFRSGEISRISRKAFGFWSESKILYTGKVNIMMGVPFWSAMWTVGRDC